MIIEDYTNRLNLTDRPEVNTIRNFSEKILEKNNKSHKAFEDALNEEINEKLGGRVSTSEIKKPHRIKDEIAADPYRKKLYDASVEFESIFVKMMLNQMKKSVEKTGLIHGGYAEDIFEDMLYDEYAKNISKSSAIGIGEEIYLSLSKSLPPVTVDQKI